MITKKSLAIMLSKLEQLNEPDPKLEQYTTPSEIAADWLYNAYMLADIKNKIIIDIGAGNGILGIGALLLGAKFVIFVDIDQQALSTIVNNVKRFNINDRYAVLNLDIFDQDYKTKIKELCASKLKNALDELHSDTFIDTAIQNPPFGVNIQHKDTMFLERAFSLSPIVYSMHLHHKDVFSFFKNFAKQHGFNITHHFTYNFMIRNIYAYHTKPKHYTKTVVFRFEKTNRVINQNIELYY